MHFAKRLYLVFTGTDHDVIKLVCITWLITKLICRKLWLATRLFPLAPVSDTLSGLPTCVHSILLGISVVCMLLLVFSRNKNLARILLLAELLSCLADQNRWQPWEYQFIFMLSVFCFTKDTKKQLFLWQLIIAGLYFFSGYNKINSGFIHDIWQNIFLQHCLGISHPGPTLLRAGYIVPAAEMIAGAALLTKNFRKFSIYFLCSMHLFLLIMLSFGPVDNMEILPWNLLMPVLLYYLFYRQSFQYKRQFFQRPLVYIVLVCWWIMPWLQAFGYWDKYLSSSLYSGGSGQLYICVNDSISKTGLADYCYPGVRNIPCSPVLSIYKWSMSEMNVPPYPETRVYHALIKIMQKKYPGMTGRSYLLIPGFTPKIKIEN